MNRTFMTREKILSQFQHLTRDQNIENVVGMMDANFDHPYAWNNFTEELLQEARELWKIN